MPGEGLTLVERSRIAERVLAANLEDLIIAERNLGRVRQDVVIRLLGPSSRLLDLIAEERN